MLQGDQNQIIRHHFWRIKYTELNEIFAFMSLRSFAIGLVAVFIPIYLYVVGYSLRDIFSLYIIMFSAELIAEYPVALGIKKFGPKHLVVASIPFLLVHLFFLLTLLTYNWPLWVVAVSGGITLGLYWQSYHYDFSRAKHRVNTSKEVGRLYIVLAILGALAPLVGGFMATKFGFGWVLTLTITILILGAVLLFKTKDTNFRSGKFDLGAIEIKKISRDMIAYGGHMIDFCAAAQIWPLFLFLIVDSFAGVGLITSLALLVTVVTTYFVTRNTNGKNRVKYLRAGGFLNGLSSGLKALVSTLPQAFGANIFKSFSSSLEASPFVSEYYIHADEERRSEYIYLMESTNDIAKILYYSGLMGLTFVLSTQQVLLVGLGVGALGAFASMLMPPAKCEICGQIENKKIKLGRRITT